MPMHIHDLLTLLAGPWTARFEHSDAWIDTAVNRDGETLNRTVCRLAWRGWNFKRDGPSDKVAAIAHAISAVPEALEACALFTNAAEEVVGVLNRLGEPCPASLALAAERGRAALRKAGVEPPMTNNQRAFAELLEKFNGCREEWVRAHGTDDGFDQWFTAQVPGLAEKLPPSRRQYSEAEILNSVLPLTVQGMTAEEIATNLAALGVRIDGHPITAGDVDRLMASYAKGAAAS